MYCTQSREAGGMFASSTQLLCVCVVRKGTIALACMQKSPPVPVEGEAVKTAASRARFGSTYTKTAASL